MDGADASAVAISIRLNEIRHTLVLPDSVSYLRDIVRTLGPADALRRLLAEDARADHDPRLRYLRLTRSLGADINGSPTVAVLEEDVVGILLPLYVGISGRFDRTIKKEEHDLRLGPVAPEHAEGRVLSQLARDMKALGLRGGMATLWVDKQPCRWCAPILPSITKQYDVTLTIEFALI